MQIDLALQQLLGATQDQARAKATVDTLRAELEVEAKRRVEQDGAAPTWKAAGLGTVRWDVPADPAVTVTKPAELASFLAERDPAAVVATITVSADHLEAALSALTFSGVPAEAEVTLVPDLVQRWLQEAAEVHPADTGTGYAVSEVVRTEHGLARGVSVPGVEASRKAPRLVVTLEAARKREAQAAGVEAAEAAAGAMPAPAPIPAPRTPVETFKYTPDVPKDALVNACLAAGVSPRGTKQQLVERLNGAL